MASGWVKLHRRITEHWIYQEKPYDKRSAWNDLVMSANHKEGKLNIGNRIIKVERGSFITSEVKLAERWGWTRQTVRNFLKLLENDCMLTKKSTSKYTSIIIANYGFYQGEDTTKDTATEHQPNINRTSTEHQIIHKQEVKEYKECKNEKNIVSTQEIISNYQRLTGDNNMARQERLLNYLDDGLEGDLIIDCIRDSLVADMPEKYLFGILDRCAKEKVTTLQQYIGRKKQHQERANKLKQKDKKQHNNFDQREYDDKEFEKYYIDVTEG